MQLECSTCIESGSAGNETLLRFKPTVALGGIALEKPFGFMKSVFLLEKPIFK